MTVLSGTDSVYMHQHMALLSCCIVITLNRCGEQPIHRYVPNCQSYISAKNGQVWSTFGQGIAKIKRVPFL